MRKDLANRFDTMQRACAEHEYLRSLYTSRPYLDAGGIAALKSGVDDIRSAGKTRKSLLLKKTALEQKQRAFRQFLQVDAPDQDTENDDRSLAHRRVLLLQELAVLEGELQALDGRLGINRHHRDVGAGSASAGLISLIRAIVDVAVKPLAFVRPETVEVTGTLLSSVAVGLGPLAAIAGLFMGVKAKVLSHAQRKVFLARHKLTPGHLGAVTQATGKFLSQSVRHGLERGRSEARTSLAGTTDLLTTVSLEAALASPRHSATLVDYMLEDLTEDVRYLDDEIEQKIALYGPHAGATSHPASGPATAVENLAGVTAAPFRQHVDMHFHAIGQRLSADRQRLAEMQQLCTQLRQWKTRPAPEPALMTGLQARYLALQQHESMDMQAHTEQIQPTARRWAEDLLQHARRRDRATLGRLQVFTLDTAALRSTASALKESHASKISTIPQDLQLPPLSLECAGWAAYTREFALD